MIPCSEIYYTKKDIIRLHCIDASYIYPNLVKVKLRSLCVKIIVQWRGLEFFGRWLKVSKNVDHGWPTKKVLGYGTAKAVNFGLFSMIFRVL